MPHPRDSLLQDTEITVPQSDFQKYVFESLQLLRAAASRIKDNPSNGPDIGDAVIFYFVASCWEKIQARYQLASSTYKLSALASWTAADVHLLPNITVEVKDQYVVRSMEAAGIPGTGGCFSFGPDTVARWWLVLVGLITKMGLCLDKTKKKDVVQLATFSIALHSFLLQVPESLWTLGSLDLHLKACRIECMSIFA